MGSVIIQQALIEREIFDSLVRDLEEIGREAADYVRANTPVLTGYAKKSVFWVVLDEHGGVIAGDTTDGNGTPIPNSLPQHANGSLRVFVGANAPYYIWIEIGARGRAGHQALARASDLMQQRTMTMRNERRAIGASR